MLILEAVGRCECYLLVRGERGFRGVEPPDSRRRAFDSFRSPGTDMQLVFCVQLQQRSLHMQAMPQLDLHAKTTHRGTVVGREASL